jgi:hypothetical protein
MLIGTLQLLLVSFLPSPQYVISFTPSFLCFEKKRQNWGINKPEAIGTQYAYIVPGPDESENSNGIGSLFRDDEIVVPSKSPASAAFVEFINKESAALARLAVAYSPKDRTLNVKNINHVSVLNLSDDHIDIEALVCDDESCVSLAVPVSFPNNCKDTLTVSEFEFCVIENLGELNTYASQTVNEILSASDEDQKIDEEAAIVARELRSEKDIEYPDWWEYPNLNMDLAKRCEAVRKILNEDEFQFDMQRLVSRTLENALTQSLEAEMRKSGKLDKFLDQVSTTDNRQHRTKSEHVRNGNKSTYEQVAPSSIYDADNIISREELTRSASSVGTELAGKIMPGIESSRISKVDKISESSRNNEHNALARIDNKRMGVNKIDEVADDGTERTVSFVEYPGDNIISAVVVNQVGTGALGPRGMILKASISSNHGTRQEYEVVSIPYQFAKSANDEESLLDAVLLIFDSD